MFSLLDFNGGAGRPTSLIDYDPRTARAEAFNAGLMPLGLSLIAAGQRNDPSMRAKLVAGGAQNFSDAVRSSMAGSRADHLHGMQAAAFDEKRRQDREVRAARERLANRFAGLPDASGTAGAMSGNSRPGPTPEAAAKLPPTAPRSVASLLDAGAVGDMLLLDKDPSSVMRAVSLLETPHETFGQPVPAVNDKGENSFIRVGSRGTVQPLPGYRPPPKEQPAETFGALVPAEDEQGNRVFLRPGSRGAAQPVAGFKPLPPTSQSRSRYVNVPGLGLVDLGGEGGPGVAIAAPPKEPSLGPRYRNVPGVGLVDTQAEGGPGVAIPAPAATPRPETFGRPMTVKGPDGELVLVQPGSRGTIQTVEGFEPAPAPASAERFGRPVVGVDENGDRVFVQPGTRGSAQTMPGVVPALPASAGSASTDARNLSNRLRAQNLAQTESKRLNFRSPAEMQSWIDNRTTQLMSGPRQASAAPSVAPAVGAEALPATEPGANPADALRAPAPSAPPPAGPTPTMRVDTPSGEQKALRDTLSNSTLTIESIDRVLERLQQEKPMLGMIPPSTGVGGLVQRGYNATAGALTGKNLDSFDTETIAAMAGIKPMIQQALKVDSNMSVPERKDLERISESLDGLRGKDTVVAALHEAKRILGARRTMAGERLGLPVGGSRDGGGDRPGGRVQAIGGMSQNDLIGLDPKTMSADELRAAAKRWESFGRGR